MIGFYNICDKISQVLTIHKSSKDITFFEVKELYNAAYEQKAQARNALRQYRRIEARAKQMDAAYRSQLTNKMMRRAA